MSAGISVLLAIVGAPLVIQGGAVYTMDGAIHDPGVVVVDGGVIRAVAPAGKTPIPAGAEVIDASGMQVFPGFVAAGTHLGLTEIDAVKVTVDTDEGSDPVWPHLLVTDAFHAESALIAVARVAGVTHALVEPGESNTIAGRSAVMRLAGQDGHAMVVRSPAALHINLGEPPMHKFKEQKKMPSTRMGAAALIRQRFIAAREYGETWARYDQQKAEFEGGRGKAKGNKGDGPKAPKPPKRELDKEALLQALRGELPVIIRAQRRDDILTALRLSDELGLRPILSHGAEAWRLAEELGRRKLPVLLGPVRQVPSSMETLQGHYENAAILHRAGVPLAFRLGWAHDVRNLPHHVAVAVTYGLPRDAALHALTAGAADILGVGDRIGRIKVGNEASIQVTTGDPLELTTQVRHLIIAGEQIPLTNRHTRLRDRYSTP